MPWMPVLALGPTAGTADARGLTAAHAAAGQRELEEPVPLVPDLLGSDNVLVERGEDLSTSGDTRDALRDHYSLLPQPGPAGLGEDEDEQLRLVSGSPAAQRGDLPGAAPSQAPAAHSLGLGDGTSLPPATASSPAWPREDEALNVVDQAPVSSWQDPASTSPAALVQEDPDPEEPPAALLPQSQSPAREHVTGSPPALPGLGTVPSMAAESPSTPPASSRTPRRSSYTGLNGRYFQLQRQSRDPAVVAGDPPVARDPTVAGDPVGTVTQAPVLALELKGAAANTMEMWSIPSAGTESLRQEGTYSPLNVVEEEIGPGKRCPKAAGGVLAGAAPAQEPHGCAVSCRADGTGHRPGVLLATGACPEGFTVVEPPHSPPQSWGACTDTPSAVPSPACLCGSPRCSRPLGHHHGRGSAPHPQRPWGFPLATRGCHRGLLWGCPLPGGWWLCPTTVPTAPGPTGGRGP